MMHTDDNDGDNVTMRGLPMTLWLLRLQISTSVTIWTGAAHSCVPTASAASDAAVTLASYCQGTGGRVSVSTTTIRRYFQCNMM